MKKFTNIKSIIRYLDKKRITSDRGILEYFRRNYKRIGKGTSREVFEINDRYVAKVAIREVGLQQNANEYDIYHYLNMGKLGKSLLAKVYEDRIDNNVIFMEYVTLSKESKQFLKENEKDLLNIRTSPSKKIKNSKLRSIYNFEKQHQHYQIILDLHNRNVGINNRNKIKILDYGFSASLSNYYLFRNLGSTKYDQFFKHF